MSRTSSPTTLVTPSRRISSLDLTNTRASSFSVTWASSSGEACGPGCGSGSLLLALEGGVLGFRRSSITCPETTQAHNVRPSPAWINRFMVRLAVAGRRLASVPPSLIGMLDILHPIHFGRDGLGRGARFAFDFVELGAGHPEVADFAEPGGVVFAEGDRHRVIEFDRDVNEERRVVGGTLGTGKDQRVATRADERRYRVG